MLLVYDEVEVVEVVFGRTRFFPSFSRQKPSNSAVMTSFFHGQHWLSTSRLGTYKRNAPMIHPPKRT